MTVEHFTYIYVHFMCSETVHESNISKIGRTASEKVILELVKSKCLPILLYGLECFSLNISDIKLLDFTVTRFLMKLFKSSNINLINDSRYYFNSELPSELLMKKNKFIEKFMDSQSLFFITLPFSN